MHSLPSYHGLLAASAALVPMLLIYVIGAPLLQRLLEAGALSFCSGQMSPTIALKRGAALRDIQNLAAGQIRGQPVAPSCKAAAAYYRCGAAPRNGWILLVSRSRHWPGRDDGSCSARISPTFRARNHFERVVLVVLVLCAAVAVLTTIGIVFSVAYET